MKKALLSIITSCICIISFAQLSDSSKVKSVLKKYNDAIEKLDVSNTENLFTTNSKIYESGGSEGSYAHYKEHHLTPELKEFKSFTFSNYKEKFK